jgi:transcription elongation GreA/GreB family factor
MNIKETVYNLCKIYVDKRLETVENIISSNQKALQSETKSSAGDKHETGRAMLQLEMEKAGQQLAGISQMRLILAKIDLLNTSKNVHLGSLVYTNKATYFLSISAGQLTVESKPIFAISLSSPIGKLLLGKKENEEFFFNGQRYKITNIE